VSTQSTLQDALEAMLAEGGCVPVTGPRNEYLGTIHLETVIDTIQSLREEHTDSPDTAEPAGEAR
ncbi:MAG: ABC transporter, partial [Thermocrispum sp.]